MTQKSEKWENSSRVVARRLKDLRQQRGWSAIALAEACAELGMPALNRSVIANIESFRRTYVTTDELDVLAYALDVAPLHLMVPLEADPSVDAHRYVIGTERVLPIDRAREWKRGTYCPPDGDPRKYFAEVPRSEYKPPQLTSEDIDERGQAVDAHRELENEFLPTRKHRRRSQREED